MASAGKVEISLVADSARFRSDWERDVRSVVSGVGEMSASLKSLEGGFNVVKEAAGAFGIALSIAGVIAYTKAVLDQAAALQRQATSVGLSTDELQIWNAVARRTNVSTDDMTSAMEHFSRMIGEAEAGNKKAIDSLNQLGVKIFDASGHQRPFNELMREAAIHLANMTDQYKQAALGADNFGRGFLNVLPAIEQMGNHAQEAEKAARDLNQVLSAETIDAADKAAAEIDTLGTAFGNLWTTIVAHLEPAIDAWAQDAISTIRSVQDQVNNTRFSSSPSNTPQSIGAPSWWPDWLPWASLGGARPPMPGETGSRYPDTQAFLAENRVFGTAPADTGVSNPLPTGGGGGGTRVRDAAAEAAKRQAEAVKRVVEQLNFEARTAGMDADTLKLENALRQAGTTLATAYGQEILKAWQADVKATGSARQAADAQKRLNTERTAAIAIVDRFKTPMAKLTEDYRTLNQALKDGAIKQQEWIDGTKGVLAAQKQLNDQTQKLNQDIAETAKTIGSDLGSALADGITGAKTWKEAMTDAIKSIVQELAKLALKLAEKPLEDFIGQMLGTGTSPTTITGAGGMEPSSGGFVHGISGITGAQAGGHIGGASIVGEYGPEIFVPDTPGMVLNNDTLMHGFGRGGGTHYHVDARGAELGVEARVMAALRELHRSIEPRAVAAVEVSRRRGGAFAQNFRR